MSGRGGDGGERALDAARVLRPEERDRVRAHLEGMLARARERRAWRDYRDAVLCLTLLAVGPRVSELCAARRDAVRVGRGEREVALRRLKGSRQDPYRMPTWLRPILRRYLDDWPATDDAPLFPGRGKRAPLTRTAAWRIWKAACAAVGLGRRGLGPHGARHGVGMAVYRATGDVRMTAAALGHRDVRSAAVYGKPLPEDVDAVLDRTWGARQGRSRGAGGDESDGGAP